MEDSSILDFDFITDEQFRRSLVSDYKELKECQEAGSWKAIYVLAGSIVEAMLIEYLVITGIRPNGKSPLEIDLAKAIEACQEASVIQPDTASLCTVIRGYRNLIHPGRVIRLGQSITREGAHIAINLVSLIANEVSERRKANYGQTAEQIVKKVRSDQHSLVLLPSLIAETNEHERTKLIETTILEAYAAEESFIPSEDILERLRQCYRQVMESLPEATRRKSIERFAQSIRNDSIEKIQSFGDSFFSAKDLNLLSAKEAALVVKHLLTRLDDNSVGITPQFLKSIIGIGKFIPADEVGKFADILIKVARRKNISEDVMQFLTSEYDNVPDEQSKDAMTRRIKIWVDFANEKNYSELTKMKFARIADAWFDIPF